MNRGALAEGGLMEALAQLLTRVLQLPLGEGHLLGPELFTRGLDDLEHLLQALEAPIQGTGREEDFE